MRARRDAGREEERDEPIAPNAGFKRALFFVGAAHLLVLAVVGLLGLRRTPAPPQIMWLDGGVAGESGGAAAPEQSEPAPPPPQEPSPPPPQPEPVPPPEPVHPSEIVVPSATPPPATPRPTPKATPKPATPKPTPKPTPVTPKPTPKATPKSTPKASPSDAPSSPKPAASPKPPGSPKPAASPKKPAGSPGASGEGETASGEAKGKGSGKTEGATGPGKGAGKAGTGRGGGGAAEFGWYTDMIRDRLNSSWQQPTSIVRSSQKFVTKLRIKIGRDGTILEREIIGPSGNSVMDESVLAAAQKVRQIDALPAGLGGESFEIGIDFKLDQGE